VAVQPPTIVMMCNMPQAFPPNFRRYLVNVMRDHLQFSEVPIKLYLHRRGDDDHRDDVGI
jgi:GTP-binding protein